MSRRSPVTGPPLRRNALGRACPGAVMTSVPLSVRLYVGSSLGPVAAWLVNVRREVSVQAEPTVALTFHSLSAMTRDPLSSTKER